MKGEGHKRSQHYTSDQITFFSSERLLFSPRHRQPPLSPERRQHFYHRSLHRCHRGWSEVETSEAASLGELGNIKRRVSYIVVPERCTTLFQTLRSG